METRFELLIELNGEKHLLDTYKDEPISLTYNVADVADISKRNSSFSKTIKLPETRRNREIFGDISDLGVDSAFNPNKKTKAWILVDTVVVFEGYLQLRRVFVNKDFDRTDYEVVIYAENDNFFKLLGENYLTDLDFSELDHVWSESNIVSSWTATWGNGYYYPLIDYGQDWDIGRVNGWDGTDFSYISIGEMFPSTNAKYIWDKIFKEAGYTYESNFLNDKIFESLYIPFNKKEIKRDVSEAPYRFSVGMTQSYTSDTTSNIQIPADYVLVGNSGPQGQQGQQLNNQYVNLGTYRIPFNSEEEPNGDPDGVYNTSLYEYTGPTESNAQRFVCNFDITFDFYNPNIPTTNQYGLGSSSPKIYFKRSFGGVTTTIPVGGNTNGNNFIEASIPGIQYANGGARVYGQIATDILDGSTSNRQKIQPGEKVWVEVVYIQLNRYIKLIYNPAGIGQTQAWTLPVGTQVITWNSPNQFFNVLQETVLPNETITYNKIIPEKIKQKDFITSIIKMFNLYVEPSKDLDRHLIIEPRDQYYEGGEIKDWTRKLDINDDIEEQILGETQNRTTIFKYKDDKDYYNVDYKDTKAGFSYGEYQHILDNDFITGQKKVEIIFSPTPLVSVENSNGDATSIVIPKILKVNNSNQVEPTEHNIRILTRYNSSTETAWTYDDYIFNSSSSQWNAYTALTSDSAFGATFSNNTHNFAVGDWISINQADGGALKPMLQGQFKIVEIVSNKTIVIDIPFSQVGSGTNIAGVATPLDGLLPMDNQSDIFNFEGTAYKAYPYLGHFDNPHDPHYDINFGQTIGLYYPETTVTNDNLYSVYWENYMRELSDKDSRIITASFYLSPDDIARFKFNDNIFVDGQYYKVNKIQNYDPTDIRTCKVELIKTKFITVPRTFSRTKPNNPVLPPIIGPVGPPIGPPGPVKPPIRPVKPIRGISTGFNIVTTGDTVVAGSGNVINSNGTFVGGDGNTLVGDKSLVIGDSNDVSAEKSFVMGDNNTITEDAKGSFIFGDNQTADQPGMIIIEGRLVMTSNYVQAGRNEIVNPFFDNSPVNYISASLNAVREWGSYTSVNYLSGGRYEN